MRRGVAALATSTLGFGFLTFVTGCASVSPCQPSNLAVEPTAISPGHTLHLSARPAACGLKLKPNLVVKARLTSSGTTFVLGAVPISVNGRIDAVLAVPANVPPGEGHIEVSGNGFPPCADKGSCAGYGASVRITAE